MNLGWSNLKKFQEVQGSSLFSGRDFSSQEKQDHYSSKFINKLPADAPDYMYTDPIDTNVLHQKDVIKDAVRKEYTRFHTISNLFEAVIDPKFEVGGAVVFHWSLIKHLIKTNKNLFCFKYLKKDSITYGNKGSEELVTQSRSKMFVKFIVGFIALLCGIAAILWNELVVTMLVMTTLLVAMGILLYRDELMRYLSHKKGAVYRIIRKILKDPKFNGSLQNVFKNGFDTDEYDYHSSVKVRVDITSLREKQIARDEIEELNEMYRFIQDLLQETILVDRIKDALGSEYFHFEDLLDYVADKRMGSLRKKLVKDGITDEDDMYLYFVHHMPKYFSYIRGSKVIEDVFAKIFVDYAELTRKLAKFKPLLDFLIHNFHILIRKKPTELDFFMVYEMQFEENITASAVYEDSFKQERELIIKSSKKNYDSSILLLRFGNAVAVINMRDTALLENFFQSLDWDSIDVPMIIANDLKK